MSTSLNEGFTAILSFLPTLFLTTLAYIVVLLPRTPTWVNSLLFIILVGMILPQSFDANLLTFLLYSTQITDPLLTTATTSLTMTSTQKNTTITNYRPLINIRIAITHITTMKKMTPHPTFLIKPLMTRNTSFLTSRQPPHLTTMKADSATRDQTITPPQTKETITPQKTRITSIHTSSKLSKFFDYMFIV